MKGYSFGELVKLAEAAVPQTRRVNGRSLTADVALNAADVNAAPSGFGLGEVRATSLGDMDSDPEGWNGGAFGWFRTVSATINTPENRTGVCLLQSYDSKSSKWLIYFAGADIYTRFYSASSGWSSWSKSYSNTNKPNAGDTGAVPTTRKVNSKPLSSDISLNASDVGAVPSTRTVNGKGLASDITLSATDVKALPINGGTLTDSVFVDKGDAMPSLGVRRANRLTFMADGSTIAGVYSSGLDGPAPSWLISRDTATGVITLGDVRTPTNINGKDETFTYKGKKVILDAVLAALFPVGHVIISTNSANPSSYGYPGTWELTESDTSLISVSSGAGSISGNNNPSVPLPIHHHRFSGSTEGAGEHQHGINTMAGLGDINSVPAYVSGRESATPINSYNATTSAGGHGHPFSGTTTEEGTSGASIDVRGKCLRVYVWRRTA